MSTLLEELAAHEHQIPKIPFAAWRDGIRCDVTAVLERTSVIMARDGEMATARHDALTVDPTRLRWQPAPTGWKFVGPTLKDAEQARALRARSDARARGDQERRGARPPLPTPAVEKEDEDDCLATLLQRARACVDARREDASAYAAALRAARTGRHPADPPPSRRRRPTSWDAPPTSEPDLLDELVRVYALTDELGQQIVRDRTALRLLSRVREEPHAESA